MSSTPTLRDQFRDHALWGTVDRLETAVASKTALSAEDRDRLTRLKALAATIKTYRISDVYLLPSTWVNTADNLTAIASEATRQLEGWDDDGAMPPPTVAQVTALSDNILDFLKEWPLQKNGGGRRNEEEQAILDAADAELEALRAKVESLKAEIASSSTAFTALQSNVANAEANLAALTTTTETDFGALAIASQAAIDAVQATGTQQFADSLKEAEEKTSAIVQEIEGRAQQAKTLTTLIGGAGVADGYTKYADKQNKAAFRWSLAAVLMGGAAVVYIGIALWDLRLVTTPSPAAVILKSAVSLTGLSVAGYMTRLAAHHRKQAVKARFRALDMLALGPFTDDLSEPQKQALKFQIGVASFGQDVSRDEKEALIERFRMDPTKPTIGKS